MEIAVHPDSTVTVKAPMNADISLIETRVAKKARWIFKKLDYFTQFTPTPPRCYVSGETHLYLGTHYRLKVAEGKNGVTLSRDFLHISSPTPNPETTKKLLHAWYREKALVQFKESMDRCWPTFESLACAKPVIAIRRMKTRWGSLSSRGIVTLNLELIRAPKECIDYVMIHELCHLKHHNHGPGFYQLLNSILPNWKKIKHKLEISMV